MQTLRANLWLILVLVALAAAAGAAWGVLTPPSLEAAADRIRKGMAFEEVERLLGGPPNRQSPWMDDNGRVAFWDGDTGTVAVDFDKNGRVRFSGYCPDRDPRSVREKIRREVRSLFGL